MGGIYVIVCLHRWGDLDLGKHQCWSFESTPSRVFKNKLLEKEVWPLNLYDSPSHHVIPASQIDSTVMLCAPKDHNKASGGQNQALGPP